MKAIVVRPEPGCQATVDAARDIGLDAEGFPLFAITALPWDALLPSEFDALLLGSSNALRHAGDALDTYSGMPAYAVGEKTAAAARAMGLEVVATGEGGLQDLFASLSPDHRRLLRIAGKQRVQLDPPADVALIEREVYSSDPLPMPAPLAAALRDPSVVLLHSPLAAHHFAQCCDASGIDRSCIAIAALSQRVAEAAGSGWREVSTASEPTDAALLALAGDLCKMAHTMPVDTPLPDAPEPVPAAPYPPPRRSAKGQLFAAALAFVLGAVLVGWLVWRGYLGALVPSEAPQADRAAIASNLERSETARAQPMSETEQIEAVGGVEARLAMLEDRFSRLNLQANAASGNAARAESLLIAFAARRMVDRGEQLTFLADQLQLRFANAQPRAVETIVEFGKEPVTIDQLSARLEALRPELVGGAEDDNFWDAARRELSNFFTVRREPSALMSAEARFQRAAVMLTAKRVPEAVAQVERLPGSDAARKWIADARRYDAAQKALDLIETTAMLDPNRLQDSEGNTVEQRSPLATPTGEVPVKAPRAAPVKQAP